MKKRLVGVLGALAISLALVGGPFVDEALSQGQYPPGARRCTVDIDRQANGRLRIRVFCPLLGIDLVIRVRLFSTPVDLGTARTNAQGDLDATFILPESVEPGSHHLRLFQVSPSPATGAQVNPGVQVNPGPAVEEHLVEVDSIPLTVRGRGDDRQVLVGTAADAATTSGSRSADADDGSSSAVPLTAAAIGFVGAGAAGVMIARRRRNAAEEGSV
ncbi:MAG: hypothetical protein M3144_12390 [Actinomycetota bacterium]|nr:hypothetical protein [Actinomycetota bacterium]